MRIAMVGLGRMGANIVRRLMKGGHDCVVFDINAANMEQLASEGAETAARLEDIPRKLEKPRIVWVMVPAGTPTEDTISSLSTHLEEGDIIIDGGNTYFKDDLRRSKVLKERRVHLVDVGTSGGMWGLERGYCLMTGGDAEIVRYLDPVFRTLAPGSDSAPHTPNLEKTGTAEEGYIYCGPTGAGHFVKMVHNGIEYGLMQAYAEGFGILENAKSEDLPEEYRYDLNMADIAEVWRRGSVVGSWLLDLTAMALAEEPDLSGYTGFVSDSGEGRWTIMAAIEESVPATVLSASLYKRFRSRQEKPFSERLLSAMRQKFGGHVERPTGG